MDLDAYFATGPRQERPVFEAVMAALDGIGTVHVEPVSVGIFLKRSRTFAELRPMQRWVAVSWSARHLQRHPLIRRKPLAHGGRYWHTANVALPEELDDELVGFLINAYEESPA